MVLLGTVTCGRIFTCAQLFDPYYSSMNEHIHRIFEKKTSRHTLKILNKTYSYYTFQILELQIWPEFLLPQQILDLEVN